jgi:hypothetical protein
MFAKALNRNLDLQRFKVLYICGNYSSVLCRLDRRFQDLEIRRAFTIFQLMTILEEARHSLIIIEHDPLLYEDAQGIVEYVFPRVARCLQRCRSPALLTWNRYFPGGYDQKCLQSILLRQWAESYDEAYFESLSKSAEEPDHPRGLDMIKLPWKRGARPLEPRPTVNPRLMEFRRPKRFWPRSFMLGPARWRR